MGNLILPPRPQKTAKPKIHDLTNDPLLRIVLAHHYDTDNKEYYIAQFKEEQDEIVESLYDMGFQEIKSDIELIYSDSHNATTIANPPIAPTIIIESSSAGEELDNITEQ